MVTTKQLDNVFRLSYDVNTTAVTGRLQSCLLARSSRAVGSKLGLFVGSCRNGTASLKFRDVTVRLAPSLDANLDTLDAHFQCFETCLESMSTQKKDLKRL